MNKMQRYGSYGVLRIGSEILLAQKRSGPLIGLWDLPGGGIEFGETPEEALQRELIEEAALLGSDFNLFGISTHGGTYEKNGVLIDYHLVGIIYLVGTFSAHEGASPEEITRWVDISTSNREELTPFAQYVVKKIYSDDSR